MTFEKQTIGTATLYRGDCADVMPTLQKFDAMVTDPPYGIGAKMQGGGGMAVNWKGMLADMLDWDAVAPHDLINAMRLYADYSIIWGGNYFELPPSRMYLVWAKGGGMYGRSFAECEMAWCSWDGNARFIELSPPTHVGKEIKEHPTQKPLQIMQWCIKKLPSTVKTVFDPFMGSGTTGIACVQNGLTFTGIEKFPKYFDIACKRIEQAYAQGQLFEPVQTPQVQLTLE